MANIVGFQQDPSLPEGAGTFTLDNGATYVAHDPEQAKSFVSASQSLPQPSALQPPQPDLRLAQNGPAPGGPSLAGGARDAPPPVTSDVGPAGPPPAIPAALASTALGQPAIGGAAPSAEPAPPANSALNIIRAVQAESGQGTPGTSSSSRSTSITKGAPFGAADVQRLQARSEDYSSTVDKMAERHMQDMAEQDAASKANAVQLVKQQQEKQAVEDAKGAIVQRRTDEHEAAVRDVMEDKAPAPFGGSILASVLSAIAQGIGQYQAVKNGTGKNVVAEQIQQSLDADRKDWEANVLKKKWGVEQLSKLSTEAKSDFQAARTDREITQRMLIANEIQRIQQNTNGQEKIDKLELMKQDNNSKLEDLRVKMQQEAADKVTISQSQSGSAGTRGRPLSLLDASQKAVKGGLITPEEGRAARGQTPISDAGEGMTAAESRIKTPARNVLDTISNNGPKFGLEVDPKTGEWTQSTASAIGSRIPFTTAKHAKEALVNALAPEMVKLRTGGEGDHAARESAADELRGMSPEQFTLTINQLSRNAQHIMKQKIYHGKNQVPGGAEEQ